MDEWTGMYKLVCMYELVCMYVLYGLVCVYEVMYVQETHESIDDACHFPSFPRVPGGPDQSAFWQMKILTPDTQQKCMYIYQPYLHDISSSNIISVEILSTERHTVTKVFVKSRRTGGTGGVLIQYSATNCKASECQGKVGRFTETSDMSGEGGADLTSSGTCSWQRMPELRRRHQPSLSRPHDTMAERKPLL